MNPIERLIEWRLYIFLKELGIDIKKAGYVQWEIIKRKLSTKNSYCDCEYYILLKNIIWHNIIRYEIVSEPTIFYNTLKHKTHVDLLYTNYKGTHIHSCYTFWNLHIKSVLNKQSNIASNIINDNFNKMQNLIVTYFMLSNIIMANTVIDICNEIKKWIYYVMLIKN